MRSPLPSRRATHLERGAAAVIATVMVATVSALASEPPSGAAGPFHGASRMLRLVPPRVERGPVVDGALDDSIWTVAAVLDSFTQTDPVEGLPDTLGTRCLVLYDARRLYVGFRCTEDPRRVRAPFLARQAVDPSDWVAAGIDGYHDHRRMAYFLSTPRGIQADGMIVEGHDDDDAVDFLFTSEGRMTERGYEVEMAIPFRSLRFPRRDSLTFGFNAARYIPRTGVQLSWAPISSDHGPSIAQIGTLVGLHGIERGRDLQVIPTFTASQRAEPGPTGSLRYAEADPRAGASLKYGLTSSLTTDVTVTPDFSQVEADAGVVDVNERFAIFYPERRPFFLEGREVFVTPIDIVYTRRIVDPRYGVKLTGTLGRTAIGILHAMDRSDRALLPVTDRYFGDARYDIVRIRQDVGKNSTIGFLAGERRQRDSWNRGDGIDGRLVFRKLWTLQFQGLLSAAIARDYRTGSAQDTLLAPGQRGEVTRGNAWTMALDRSARSLDAGVSVLDISPDFAADMGFVNRTDQIRMNAYVSPHFFAPGKSWYQGIHPQLYYRRIHRHGADRHVGPLTDDELGAIVSFSLPLSTEVGTGVSRAFTLHEGRRFDGQDRAVLWASSHRFSAVQGGFSFNYGDDVVFTEALPGRSLRWDAWTDLRFTPQLGASLSVAGLALDRAGGTAFARAAIPRLKLSYQHNRELSFRVIGEINSERRYDATGARVPSGTTTSLDLLASYLLRPETVCYLGYGSRLAGETVGGSRPERASTFVKLSYLWQL